MSENFMVGDTVHVNDNNEGINEKGFIIISNKSVCYCTCSDPEKVIEANRNELYSCRIVLTEQTLSMAESMNLGSTEPGIMARIKIGLMFNEIANRI